VTRSAGDLAAQLGAVRLESDTLYDVIGVIASSPDLDRVLDGIVDVLSKATDCHACFVYLREGERLRLQAASRVYAHVVGRVQFGIEEGLAGWALRNNRPAFVRDDALEDPRNHYVPELEEERFQSMAAVPIPSRGGTVLGVIVLHTIAPREFDEATIALLAHAAPLVAGVIENAQLYADARRRVAALTGLSALSERIAAASGREDLYHAAGSGVRALLDCSEARLYEIDGDRRRLVLVAADPLPPGAAATEMPATGVLLELLQRRGSGAPAAVREALMLDPAAAYVLSAPVAAGDEQLGVLVATSEQPPAADAEELLRAVANQLALALKTAELIERLTEENIVRDLFAALEQGRVEEAETLARRARCDLERAYAIVQIGQTAQAGEVAERPWPRQAERSETALRRLVPGALCDAAGERLRALLPLAAGGAVGELATLDAALARLGAGDRTAIGRSNVHRSAAAGRGALQEAGDAARVAAALMHDGGALAYPELGAYRYLVHLAAEDEPTDPYVEAVRQIADYDRRRGSQLVPTLEQYLADRRSVTETARALTVHPNTLRQRLERIETLTGLELASADLLALELAVKLARLRGSGSA
jgi:GAF domain-containing protein